MVCKKCGASLSEGSAFCSHCGTKAESAPAIPSSGNSWFTPAGRLDDQLSGTPVRKKDPSEEMPKAPVRKEPVRPIVAPAREETVKPVVPPVTPHFVPTEAPIEKKSAVSVALKYLQAARSVQSVALMQILRNLLDLRCLTGSHQSASLLRNTRSLC